MLVGRGEGWLLADAEAVFGEKWLMCAQASWLSGRAQLGTRWAVPAQGLRAVLSAAVLEGELECLLAVHQLCSGAVTVGLPLSQLCWGIFLAVT